MKRDNHLPGGPAVSILTIFHNAAPYLDEAVAGVLAQSHSDWELLLVDDGGDDGSEAIARGYADRYPGRIRYLHHPGRTNEGTGPTRNLGIANARGRFIAELDADDVWRPRFLERRVAALNAEPRAAVAFGPVVRWYGWSGRAADEDRDWVARPWDDLGEGVIEPPALLPIMLKQAPQGGVPKGVLMRRSVVEDVGGYPPEFRDMYEDQALLSKIGLRHAAVYLADEECDYLYRRHQESMVSVMNRTRDRREMRKFFLRWLDAYIRQEGGDREAARALKSELRRCRYPAVYEVAEHLAALPGRIVRKAVREGRSAVMGGNAVAADQEIVR